MTGPVIQWTAVIAEFFGLLLIAIELYLPGLSERLKVLFEDAQPRVRGRPGFWIGSYVLSWVAVVSLLSIWESSMSLFANITFSVFTSFLLVLFGISRILVRLGVVLGRGNSVAGVGLVLALIGFLLEILQLVLG